MKADEDGNQMQAEVPQCGTTVEAFCAEPSTFNSQPAFTPACNCRLASNQCCGSFPDSGPREGQISQALEAMSASDGSLWAYAATLDDINRLPQIEQVSKRVNGFKIIETPN